MTLRRRLLVPTLLLSAASLHGQVSGPTADSQAFLEWAFRRPETGRPGVSAAVALLLARMTLEEKVGQMTQLEVGMVTEGKDADLRIDPARLRTAVVEQGVGSILNVNAEALPPSKWHELICEIQAAAGQTRLKIPVLYGIDSIHGATYVRGATLFPQPLGLAATWNPERVVEASRVTAAETRAAGIPWNFSPLMDVGRQPLWPRLYETFGEDVHLATVMGVAAVRGYEGDDVAAPSRVAACLKHYVGYSVPASGRDRTPAAIPEVQLREHFLPPFAAGVRAGARTVMVNSGEVNGVPGHVNGRLLKDVLRGEMGFRGVVVSDWEDIKKLVGMHHAAATEKEATRLAILAGIDMSMVPSDLSFSRLLVELVREGAVPVSRIDEAVSRILTLKMDLGLFEDPLRGMESKDVVGSAKSREVSLRAARESLTLLKNQDGVLPLAAGSRILVTGPTADSLVSLNNGWTLVWQGDKKEIYPSDRSTILGAIHARAGASHVTWVPGASYDAEIDVAAAAAAAQRSDVTVLCLGEMSYAETPGDITDLSLPAAQLRLASALVATGKPVVLVLVEGRPRIIQAVADGVRGILMAYNPGMEGGQAVADVLFGDVNPSGRLPFTYPRDPNSLLTYDHKTSEQKETKPGRKAFHPQFEFGYGLSYTTFAYSGLKVVPGTVAPGGTAEVVVTVGNTGRRSGAEVVQLFLSDHVASVTPPVKRLKRFTKLTLDPGERREVRFRLTPDDFAFVGADGKPTVEAGGFSVKVAGLTESFVLQ